MLVLINAEIFRFHFLDINYNYFIICHHSVISIIYYFYSLNYFSLNYLFKLFDLIFISVGII